MKLTIPAAGVPSLNKAYSANNWQRAKLVKAAHEYVRLMVYAALGGEFEMFRVPVNVSITMYGSQPLDPDNTAKLVLDGLVHAGVLEDDSWKHIDTLTLRSRKAKKAQARFEVEIEAA
jgi:Holliday junction resolvase RusA-like endonuclease